jgi:hypothetical protein
VHPGAPPGWAPEGMQRSSTGGQHVPLVHGQQHVGPPGQGWAAGVGSMQGSSSMAPPAAAAAGPATSSTPTGLAAGLDAATAGTLVNPSANNPVSCLCCYPPALVENTYCEVHAYVAGVDQVVWSATTAAAAAGGGSSSSRGGFGQPGQPSGQPQPSVPYRLMAFQGSTAVASAEGVLVAGEHMVR